MEVQDLFRLKKKGGPGSAASSVRSGKSVYKHKPGASSSHSATSALVRDIISHIPDKEKPQAIRLTNKIKEIKEAVQVKKVVDMYEELIAPYNRQKYYDKVELQLVRVVEEARARQLNRLSSMLAPNTTQQKEPQQKPESVIKFQRRMNMLIVAFRTLRKMYYPSDLYRLIVASSWVNLEEQANEFFNSAFIASRIFAAGHIARLAHRKLLKAPSILPDRFSISFLNTMLKQASGEYLGTLQGKILEAFTALMRIPSHRETFGSVLHSVLQLYREGRIYNSNLPQFVRLFSELALYQDINWQDYNLLDLFLELIDNPVSQSQTSLKIVEMTSPELLKLYGNTILEEPEEPEGQKREEQKDEQQSQTSGGPGLSRKMSRKSSIASISSIRRVNTRSALLMSQKSLLRNMDFQHDLMDKTERLKELRKSFREYEQKKNKEKMMQFAKLDEVDPTIISQLAARGLSWLMLPCSSFSFIDNIGQTKQTIYDQLLQRQLLHYILHHPSLTEENSEVKRSLTTVFTLFVLQTTTQSVYEGEYVIFYLKNLGLLDVVSAWSKDPDLVVRANSAWMFAALCVHHLVPPLELTKQGLVRDMFVLFIKLYLEPTFEHNPPDEAENIAEKVLNMYDYQHFFDHLGSILNRAAKIQHLIFATLIFLSTYDDQNIMAALHKPPDSEVDKPVEENALCGLIELLQKSPEEMKLFIKILIQFTICDDDSFQQNGIWYLKHIIINNKLSQLVEAQNVGILEVFIAGSVCESEVIQQECVSVLTYLAIEKKAYRGKDDLLLDALMYLTGVQFKRIRGLAYNGLAALALHGSYAADALLRQANIPDYFNSVTKNLKRYRQQFVEENYKRDTVAEYAGINLLLNLSRSATPKYQEQVCERVPLILDTIAAQNQLKDTENMNEVGCLQTIRALTCSSNTELKELWVVPFIDRIAKDKSFKLTELLISPKFVPWALNLLLESKSLENCSKTVDLLRAVLYLNSNTMNFEQEETNIRELFKKLLRKFPWKQEESLENYIHEGLAECTLLTFLREKNIVLAVSEEVIEQVKSVLGSFNSRVAGTKLALSKHLASTANLPQTQNLMVRNIPQTLEITQRFLDEGCYEEKFNITRLLVFLTRFPDFDSQAYDQGLLEKCSKLIRYFEFQDLHPLVQVIGNLLVYSRGNSKRNEFTNFFSKGYFEELLRKAKQSDCHSLVETFLELLTKLLIENEFCDLLFEDKSKRGQVKDILNVLIRAVAHDCEERCDDLSSQAFPFSVHGYTFIWIGLKHYGFAVASHLLRLGYCQNKLKKHNFGVLSLRWFQKACEYLNSRRSVDPACLNLLNELCLFIQLNYSLLQDLELANSLTSQFRNMCTVINNEKVTDFLQARVGALLLHTALTAPITDDQDLLKEKITMVTFTMTNSSLPDLHNLAVWALKQLYKKCEITEPSFDYKEVFRANNAVKNVIPKLVEPHQPVQENALQCLAALFQYNPMKEEFLELSALDSLMYLGITAFRSVQQGRESDLGLLSSFGQALAELINNRNSIHSILMHDYQIMQFICSVLQFSSALSGENASHTKLYFSYALLRLLRNSELHMIFLQTKVGEQQSIGLLRQLAHSGETSNYEQLKVDNSIAHCFEELAKNKDNQFHEGSKFTEFTSYVNKVCEAYDKGDYLSKVEVDTHTTVLTTLRELVLRKMKKVAPNPTDDDLENFLQELSSKGALDPFLFFEYSNVPDIRKLATDTLNLLAPPNSQ